MSIEIKTYELYSNAKALKTSITRFLWFTKLGQEIQGEVEKQETVISSWVRQTNKGKHFTVLRFLDEICPVPSINST